MIVSFADDLTRALAGGEPVRRFVQFEAVARRKLRQLEIAGLLCGLRLFGELRSSWRERSALIIWSNDSGGSKNIGAMAL